MTRSLDELSRRDLHLPDYPAFYSEASPSNSVKAHSPGDTDVRPWHNELFNLQYLSNQNSNTPPHYLAEEVNEEKDPEVQMAKAGRIMPPPEP
ncbi:hypothetical protein CRG98_002684 [Punica granatum]|uniref:Uncharacterized protein n=1 Tax=Punica granatum TaxID=22663 RepID=A0A2I0L868_PUNGR|nr:hypothetical protein CRG98_002684 [Punica granatum]